MEFNFTNIAIMVGVGFVALVILGAILEYREKTEARRKEEEEEERERREAEERAERKRKEAEEKAERERKEAEEEAERERLAKICPQCHSEDAIECSVVRVDYRLIGKANETVWVESPIKRLEATMDKYRVINEHCYTCKFCDYTRIDREEDNTTPIHSSSARNCPKCRGKLHWRDTKTLDRYEVQKPVKETTAQGKKKIRNVKSIKVVEEYLFGCEKCDFTTTATITRELD